MPLIFVLDFLMLCKISRRIHWVLALQEKEVQELPSRENCLSIRFSASVLTPVGKPCF